MASLLQCSDGGSAIALLAMSLNWDQSSDLDFIAGYAMREAMVVRFRVKSSNVTRLFAVLDDDSVLSPRAQDVRRMVVSGEAEELDDDDCWGCACECGCDAADRLGKFVFALVATAQIQSSR